MDRITALYMVTKRITISEFNTLHHNDAPVCRSENLIKLPLLLKLLRHYFLLFYLSSGQLALARFAESHKKGQFHSGFKRGNKKFRGKFLLLAFWYPLSSSLDRSTYSSTFNHQVSGHSKQDKHHSEGHIKWSGKKSKGNHYWSYKHKPSKKHYAAAR